MNSQEKITFNQLQHLAKQAFHTDIKRVENGLPVAGIEVSIVPVGGPFSILSSGL